MKGITCFSGTDECHDRCAKSTDASNAYMFIHPSSLKLIDVVNDKDEYYYGGKLTKRRKRINKEKVIHAEKKRLCKVE